MDFAPVVYATGVPKPIISNRVIKNNLLFILIFIKGKLKGFKKSLSLNFTSTLFKISCGIKKNKNEFMTIMPKNLP